MDELQSFINFIKFACQSTFILLFMIEVILLVSFITLSQILQELRKIYKKLNEKEKEK